MYRSALAFGHSCTWRPGSQLSLILGRGELFQGITLAIRNSCNKNRKRQFVHKIFVHTPPSRPSKWWLTTWISIRRTSNRIANTQPKLRTNTPKIANKLNYEHTLNIFWGKIFPLRDNWADFPSEGKFSIWGIVSLENSFPFPLECTVFPGNEGFRERNFYGLREILTFPREGKFTSSHFLPQKMLWVMID